MAKIKDVRITKINFHPNNRGQALPQGQHSADYSTQEPTIEPVYGSNNAPPQPSYTGDPKNASSTTKKAGK
jgi:hypothetical protein